MHANSDHCLASREMTVCVCVCVCVHACACVCTCVHLSHSTLTGIENLKDLGRSVCKSQDYRKEYNSLDIYCILLLKVH